jgi:hypothetical protein
VFHVSADFTYTKTIFGAFATFFVLLTHIPNIKRLLRGTEPKLGEQPERKGEEDDSHKLTKKVGAHPT